MREVRLCQLPSLSIDYNHVMDFNTIEERDTYFNNRTIYTINSPTKYDYTKQTLTINKPIESLQTIDYVVITENNNRLFYFIINKETLNSNNTILYLKVDVWTTYMFKYTLQHSYVERGHQRRWLSNGNPVVNIEDEGFIMGDYIQEGVESIYTYNNGIIISTTAPLGEIEDYVAPPLDYGGSSDSNKEVEGLNPGVDKDSIPNINDYIESGELPSDGWTDISWDMDFYERYNIEGTNFDITLEHGVFGYPPKIGLYLGDRFITTSVNEYFTEYIQGKLFKMGNEIYLVLRKDKSITDIKRCYQINCGDFDIVTAKYEIDTKTGLPSKGDFSLSNPSSVNIPLHKTYIFPKNCPTAIMKQNFNGFTVEITDTGRETLGQPIYKLVIEYNNNLIYEYEMKDKEYINKFYYLSLCVSNGVLHYVSASENYKSEGYAKTQAIVTVDKIIREYS